MRFEALQTIFPTAVVFSTELLLQIDPSFNRENLFHRQKSEKIIQIKKWWYVFPDRLYDESDLFRIAHQIVQPSYVSLESALSYYGLIPETVITVTSVTTKKTQQNRSTIGVFSYAQLHTRLFRWYTLVPDPKGSFYMARIEKALLDYLYLHHEMNSNEAFEERRIYREGLREVLDYTVFEDFTARFAKKALRKRADLFLHYLKNA